MKKTFLMGMAMLGAVSFTTVNSVCAQSAIKKTGNAVGKAASDVGNKTAEVAVKGTSAVKDKKYSDHYAPDGSAVYIDKKDKKYYINKKGKKIYLQAKQISTKKPVKK